MDGNRPSEIDPAVDKAWMREVTLRLTPHPALKGGKRRVVELDFGMTDGFVELKMRLCLAFYLERQFGLDRDPANLEPERQQVILANREELLAAKKEAGIDCEQRDG